MMVQFFMWLNHRGRKVTPEQQIDVPLSCTTSATLTSRSTVVNDSVYKFPKNVYGRSFIRSLKFLKPVADVHINILTRLQSNFFHFHAVFRKIWPNNRLTPLRLAPPMEILDSHLKTEQRRIRRGPSFWICYCWILHRTLFFKWNNLHLVNKEFSGFG